MDDLARAAQRLLDRPELAPPPIEFVERSARRRQRRVRTGIATGVVALVTALVLVVALVADDPGDKQNIIATQPSTSVPAPTATVSPTTAAPAARPLPHTSYRAGDFDVTEYSFQLHPELGPGTLTLTPGAVWVGTGRTLVRVDAGTNDIDGTRELGGEIVELTSSPTTVYALVQRDTGRPVVVAVDARTLAPRWQRAVSGQTQNVLIALGAGSLWVAHPGTPNSGELLSLDPRSGATTSSTLFPVLPRNGMVVTSNTVWIGATDFVVRIDLGPTRPRTMQALG
jgi:hypothetical protein